MTIVQSLKENLAHTLDKLKMFVFGENNARIDKLIDQFYGLRPLQRARLRSFGIAIGVCALGAILIFYLYGLYSLQNKLNYATDAYRKIQESKANFILVQTEYTKTASKIESENQVTTLIPAIEHVAKSLNITIDSFDSNIPMLIELPVTSVLSNQFKKAKIDFKISGISLKRLIDFLNNVHTLPNKFALTNLEIMQVFGNKLYFNAIISFEAYIPKQQKD